MNREIEMKKLPTNHENEVENYTTPSKPDNQNHNYNSPTLSHVDDEITSDENCTGEDDEGSENFSVLKTHPENSPTDDFYRQSINMQLNQEQGYELSQYRNPYYTAGV
jgi:hypothetical protein